MPTDVRTSELVINKLSKQQYESIQNPSDTEIYLVPEDEEHKPICYPTTASEVKATSMIVKSSVSDNGNILTENGFVYNTSGNPTISDTKIICDLGVGQFEKTLENLTRNTEYHIKSYGQNNNGISYGGELVQRTSNNPIPLEYQLVEYLESNGTQMILMPMNCNEIYSLHINCSFTNNTSGCYGGGFSWARMQLGIDASHRIYIWNNITTSDILYQALSIYTYYDFFITRSKVQINSNIKYTTAVLPNFSYTLFCRNNDGILQEYAHSRLTVAEFGTIEDGDYNYQLYPVYRKSDNKPGMYDIVNGVFYTNQGTGEFVVGPDKEFDDN